MSLRPSRRDVLQLPGAAMLAAQPGAGTALPKGVWIDPRQAALAPKPWRKIHLDFHNSQHVAKIGAGFRAAEFGQTLADARVNAIVVFAKDMHGYFYYPSKYGPVHPGLGFDLLGAQVEECRRRNIAVYAYYCTCWDHYLAERHPEWLQVTRERTTYLPKFNEPPGWTGLCLAHKDFVQLMLDHAAELVSRYPLDGAWFDMPVARDNECFCRVCLEAFRQAGQDPMDRRAQHERSHALHVEFLKKMHAVVSRTRPGCQIDYNQQGHFGLDQRTPYMDNVDLEALPTGGWGYSYFPALTRYVRTRGITVYGMTGRFLMSWADFGGLKSPDQMMLEAAWIVAHGARVDAGDQPPPSARLDPAVYRVVGKAYAHIEKIEPYLEGAVPVSEAALIVDGWPAAECRTEATYGMVKLLEEARVQFDLVEPDDEWERYGLIAVGDDRPLRPETAERLRRFIEGGGAALISHHGGLLEGRKQSWLEPFGLTYNGESPFQPAYLVPKTDFTGGLSDYEYALYDGASQWKAAAGARVVAALGEPAFQRSAKQYTSHRQTPFERETEYAAAALSGRLALAGFPLGASYLNRGYWVYRSLFRHLLDAVKPQRLLECDAPPSADVLLLRQPKQRRWVVHIVNFSASRGVARHPVYHDNPAPLTDITVRLNLPVPAAAALAAVAGARLPLRRTAAGVEVKVPRVPIHEVLVLEEA
jgi:hypothetical protein